MSLRQIIEQEIRACGPIPFSRYMELCLYHPELGYYTRNAAQFGKAGDFYTSSDVHAVFGRLLARQFEEMWRALDRPAQIEIREIGPGRGLFAQDVLDWSEKKFPQFFSALRYVLVEASPALRDQIERILEDRLKSGRAVLAEGPPEVTADALIAHPTQSEQDFGWRSASSAAIESEADDGALAPAMPAVLFANEFFDALPVEIVSARGSLRIDVDRRQFVETWAPLSPEEFEFLDRYSIHPEENERMEISLAAHNAADELFAQLGRGFSTIIDYGYTRDEQLAGRHHGTLKTIRQHSVSANPYEAPGEQDITADINFTALAGAAEKHGLRAHKLITQSQFLLGIGESTQFADAFQDCRLPQERAKVALQLKHLVTPAGMGESFHVLVASKGVDQSKASSLAGLSFGVSTPDK
ncbi:MAG TPA: SAM-dependent methyltransferase [Candidatus Sulfotelmatobacter sp.]|nr:SAM-dependent methyltransferase [Candidatus Sulfotelmatobacter sp.]